MNKIELIGILASLIIIISMSFRSYTFKGAMAMRIINIVGSLVFVVYGMLLPAYSTALLNMVLIFVNLTHVSKLIKHKEGLNS